MNRFLFITIFFFLSFPLIAQEEKASAIKSALEEISKKTETATPTETAISTPTTSPSLSPSSTPSPDLSSTPTLAISSTNQPSNPSSATAPIAAPSEKPKKTSKSDADKQAEFTSTSSSNLHSSPIALPPIAATLPTLKGKGSTTELISSQSSVVPSPSSNVPNDKIKIQFPHTSIQEILSLYETLTGKRIIRDSNLSGPELSIMIADPISKKDAVSILESSMLLNGYTLVPSDEKTIKILGPNRPPRTEGVPLYLEESALPVDGDKLVSFYQPLHFLTPNEAINILQGVVQFNPFGSIVAVPNKSALVMTDKTPIVRKALAILQVIDHEPSQIITEFIQLQRADAEKTVDTLYQIFGKESSSIPGSSKAASSGSSGAPGGPGGPGSLGKQGQPAVTQSSSESTEEERVVSGKVQFVADKRTNRILLVTRAENYRYVRELIDKLDQAQQPEEPLVRPLNYMSVTDVFPVLIQMLKNKDDDSSTNNITATPQATSANGSKNSNGIMGGGLGGSSGSMDGSSGSSSSGGMSGSGGGNTADRLNESTPQAPPQSAIIGATSLVADPTANSIIVYGPPESKAKARQIIDLLDQRPKQVYLAAVIGQMKLGNGMDYGAAYLFHYKGFNTLLSGDGSQLIPPGGGAAGIPTTAANALAQGAGGLTLFGAISGSVDAYANFLETTGKFRTIARPVVYTSNNRKATIFSGQRIPYQSSTLSSVVAGSPTPNPNQSANSLTANISYQDVLLKLEVIPLINSDKEVNLIISQQNQSVDVAATAALTQQKVNAPVVNTQELNTSVRIPSGSTIVLGGLIQDEKEDNKSGIPYLSALPVIGPLLGGHTKQNRNRTELVVMIQPIVIDSNETMQKVSEEEGGKSELGKKAKNLKYQLEPPPMPKPKKKGILGLFGPPKPQNF
ncbi:MAG: hypothetical protein K2W99_01625 [Chthoniobacterales bacterium]|nr:hypothetical protein [Chthoniobacterales bacterium]